MTRTLPAVLAALTLVLAVPVSAAAAPARGDAATASPHSRAAVYVHQGIVVRRMLFRGQRIEDWIAGEIGFAVENRSDEDRTVALRVGRCTSGTRRDPVCPSAYKIAVRVPAGGRRSVFRGVKLRQPPARQDAVELSVTLPGALPPFGTSSELGNLLLGGRAWRGSDDTWYRYDTPREKSGPEVLRARLAGNTALTIVLPWPA
jgi:hypothetical protein